MHRCFRRWAIWSTFAMSMSMVPFMPLLTLLSVLHSQSVLSSAVHLCAHSDSKRSSYDYSALATYTNSSVLFSMLYIIAVINFLYAPLMFFLRAPPITIPSEKEVSFVCWLQMSQNSMGVHLFSNCSLAMRRQWRQWTVTSQWKGCPWKTTAMHPKCRHTTQTMSNAFTHLPKTHYKMVVFSPIAGAWDDWSAHCAT